MTDTLNGYACFYNRKRIEVYAKSSYAARMEVRDLLKVPASKTYLINVVLAEKNGEAVTHLPTF
jgi:hypothetical protein